MVVKLRHFSPINIPKGRTIVNGTRVLATQPRPGTELSRPLTTGEDSATGSYDGDAIDGGRSLGSQGPCGATPAPRTSTPREEQVSPQAVLRSVVVRGPVLAQLSSAADAL